MAKIEKMIIVRRGYSTQIKYDANSQPTPILKRVDKLKMESAESKLLFKKQAENPKMNTMIDIDRYVVA